MHTDNLTTVIIIDDHPFVRAGMKTVLNAAPNITVIDEGSTESIA